MSAATWRSMRTESGPGSDFGSACSMRPLAPDARIAIIRPDGIGDQILCLPTATALRRLMPHAHITFVSSSYAAPLFEHHPDLDAILPLTRQETLGELVRLFR